MMLSNKQLTIRTRFKLAGYATAGILIAGSLPEIAIAQPITVASVFSEHMVLQRGQDVPVWGRANTGDEISVSVSGISTPDSPTTRVTARADAKGTWRANLPPSGEGGPFVITIGVVKDARTSTVVTFNNVLFGDVWLCSGQSNMGFPLNRARDAKADIEQSSNPLIRLLKVRSTPVGAPADTLKENPVWEVCGPTSSAGFSAVGYYFGRDLQKHLGVPIGLIGSSVGGTSAECWVSREGLRPFPEFDAQITRIEQDARDPKAALQRYDRDVVNWYKELREKDPGYGTTVSAENAPWWTSELSSSDWEDSTVPAAWSSTPGLKSFSGTAWFRKDIEVPAGWSGTTLTLGLGKINEEDVTWFNGQQIGQTTSSGVVRRYTVPAALVREGRNTITVRVFGSTSASGLSDNPDALFLAESKQASAAADKLSLAGVWKYRKGASLTGFPRRPIETGAPRRPIVLYNGMIAPLVPYALKGAIWYQGESNVTRADQYRRLFPALIADWRKQWQKPELPFLFVQLPYFHAKEPEPGEDKWAELREAQLMTLRNVPATGMAISIDTGDAKDIHPVDKQDISARLALAARAAAYGEKLEWSGPLFTTASVENSEMRVSFEHVGSGLATLDKSENIRGFAIAGSDRKFAWADARIDPSTNTVIVSSSKVSQPVAVRYAWAANPDAALCNREGLPASPFRTDTWPGITEGNTKDSIP